jgi:hypothetical protein
LTPGRPQRFAQFCTTENPLWFSLRFRASYAETQFLCQFLDIEVDTHEWNTALPEFSWYNIPKRWNIDQIPAKCIYQMAMKYMYQMVMKYSEWPQNIPTLSVPKPSKIFQNWDFWFENVPSGNPGGISTF